MENNNNRDVVLYSAAKKIRRLCDDYLNNKSNGYLFTKHLKRYSKIACSRSSFNSVLYKIDNFIFR
jgi:hypothetical protein